MADATPQGRYLVTARKYRPQTFADLVAQEHVAQTLQNAILHDRLAQAYLFSGPRGVGKTTAARLLAKAINCTTPLDERTGAEPCRTCTSCRAFEEGRSLNIIEVDAASNNRVDDIRDLREKVRIPPQGARKKIYILDEVHMLSQGAFNALLKTLEEPPPHVLFIFATTEPHKVLPTILSRTQRFDFRRIAVPEIVSRLQHIAQAEAIQADDEALMLLARKGDGALRDALSIFDQAVSLCGSPLRYDTLADALGVVDTDLFFETTTLALAQDRAGMLQIVDRLMTRGYDLTEFVVGLAEHLRDLLAVKTTGDGTLIEATAAAQARYVEAAGPFAEADLLRMLMVVDETEQALKAAPQPRLKLELALLKLASLARTTDLAAVLAKLERLEAALASGKLEGSTLTLPEQPAAPTPSATASASPSSEAMSSGIQSPAKAAPGAAGNAAGDGSASPTPPSPTAAPGATSEYDAADGHAAADPAGTVREPSLPSTATTPTGDRTPGQPLVPSALVASGDTSAALQPPASSAVGSTAETPVESASSAATVPAPASEPATPSVAAEPSPPSNEVDAKGEAEAKSDDAGASADEGIATGDGQTTDDGYDDLPPIDAYDDLAGHDAYDDYSASELPSPSAPVATEPATAEVPADSEEPPRPPVGSDAAPLLPGLFDPPALRRPTNSAGDGTASSVETLTVTAPSDLPGADDFGVSLGRVEAAWPGLHARVKAERVHIGALLSQAQPHRVHRGAVEVVVPDRFTCDLLTSEVERLAAHLADELGADENDTPALRFVVATPEALPETAAPADPFEAFKQLRQTHPVVRLLFERFGAEIVY